MKTLKKTAVVLGTLAFITSMLAGCNTVQGAGEDIQAGGHAITKAAS